MLKIRMGLSHVIYIGKQWVYSCSLPPSIPSMLWSPITRSHSTAMLCSHLLCHGRYPQQKVKDDTSHFRSYKQQQQLYNLWQQFTYYFELLLPPTLFNNLLPLVHSPQYPFILICFPLVTQWREHMLRCGNFLLPLRGRKWGDQNSRSAKSGALSVEKILLVCVHVHMYVVYIYKMLQNLGFVCPFLRLNLFCS